MIRRSPRLAAALVTLGLLALTLALQIPGMGALSTIQQKADAGEYGKAEGNFHDIVHTWGDRGALPSAAAFHDAAVLSMLREDPTVALVNWRAASIRAPRDTTIQRHLAALRKDFERRPPPVDPGPGWTLVLTPAELGLIATLVWCLVSWTAIRARRREIGALIPIAHAVIAVTLSVAAWQGHTALRPPVVVVQQDAAGRLVPDPAIEATVRWPVGTEVLAVDKRPGFTRVIDSTGKTGWVIDEHLAWPLGTYPRPMASDLPLTR